jgi:uncharacterized membrane protein YtjA (UPF0391 family)
MVKAGIILIVLAVLPVPLAFAAAIFGFGGLAGDAFWASKIFCPILLVGGIILVAVGVNRGRSRVTG